jgi:hypothetical protein
MSLSPASPKTQGILVLPQFKFWTKERDCFAAPIGPNGQSLESVGDGLKPQQRKKSAPELRLNAVKNIALRAGEDDLIYRAGVTEIFCFIF